MVKQFFGPLEEIVDQEEKRREEENLVRILELIWEMDEGVVAVIEESILSSSKCGKEVAVRDFSIFLTAEKKEKLKCLLLLYKPEVIRQLQEKGFSFTGEYVGA